MSLLLVQLLSGLANAMFLFLIVGGILFRKDFEPGQPAADRADHIPDAEIHWPSIDGSPYAGQIWAIEVELTPKSAGRTTRIMAELLAPMQYALVVYLTAARARWTAGVSAPPSRAI